MKQKVTEGLALLLTETPKKISKDMDVFYNPIMKHNRDISILLLNSIDNKKMRICLPLAGSGIRGIRFIKELKKNKIRGLTLNDYSKDAIKSIKKNITLNKIKNKKNIIKNKDANLLLLNSEGFDYIDVDPFGSPNFLLDSAVKRISRQGILAVTATDTAALSGTYPKVTRRKYWAESVKDEQMHETGLRILIRKCQLIGAQFDKALIPIFSYFKDHYFRIFFLCIKGKKEVDKIIKQHGIFNSAGPLWLGKLWNKEIANKMYKLSLKTDDIDLIYFLKTIKDESKINSVGFYDLHQIVKKNKRKSIPKKELIINKIKKAKHKVSETHFSRLAIRSDIELREFLKILR